MKSFNQVCINKSTKCYWSCRTSTLRARSKKYPDHAKWTRLNLKIIRTCHIKFIFTCLLLVLQNIIIYFFSLHWLAAYLIFWPPRMPNHPQTLGPYLKKLETEYPMNYISVSKVYHFLQPSILYVKTLVRPGLDPIDSGDSICTRLNLHFKRIYFTPSIFTIPDSWDFFNCSIFFVTFWPSVLGPGFSFV